MANPNPGSHLALREGCLCPEIDNHYGKGFPWGGRENKFWISADCPLHGPWSSNYPKEDKNENAR